MSAPRTSLSGTYPQTGGFTGRRARPAGLRPDTERDLAGHDVYRSCSGAPRNATPLYRVTAVDRAGSESDPSARVPFPAGP